jgi:hypothetical protein
MCHHNDALACPSERIAKQNSSVLIHLSAGHALAAALQNPQTGERFASFPNGAGASLHACINDPDHGAQA